MLGVYFKRDFTLLTLSNARESANSSHRLIANRSVASEKTDRVFS